PGLRLRTVWQHQRHVDPTMDVRVLADAAVLLGAWAREDGPLPAPLTVVAHQGHGPWSAPTDALARCGPLPAHVAERAPRCPYEVVSVASLAARGDAPPSARVALALLDAAVHLQGSDKLWRVFVEHLEAVVALWHTGGSGVVRRL